MTFKDLLDQHGLTMIRFERMYNIPHRTVYSWYMGYRKSPDWVMNLIIESLERREQDHGQKIQKS